MEPQTEIKKSPLTFKVVAKCSHSSARVGILEVTHSKIQTPVFMPVGTQGTLKGIVGSQLDSCDCNILLGNTYHLGLRPGIKTLSKAGGLHKFMNWKRGILSDSGGFQMVSLLQLADITEEGVRFQSPYDDSMCNLTPEHSTGIQNVIGADIIMQLDDVVKTTVVGPRVEEAMYRTIRWVDRCAKAHNRNDSQSLFPIVQGGLNEELRKKCVESYKGKPFRGFAVGGLSGGESKDDFWKIALTSSSLLPPDKPRYLMGVGFAVDLVVCVALGFDMFDCVFPTRTARFGCALVSNGQMNLKQKKYALEMIPIDADCTCSTCKHYTRSYLHHIATAEPVLCSLLSIHNVNYQMDLIKEIRNAIVQDRFPLFVKNFMAKFYENRQIPGWVYDALKSVNICI